MPSFKIASWNVERMHLASSPTSQSNEPSLHSLPQKWIFRTWSSDMVAADYGGSVKRVFVGICSQR